jgi:hypothetical protein
MAKKIDGFSEEPMGGGWKRCPACEGYVKGPVTKVCPSCGHEFAFKSKLVARPIPQSANREQELEQVAMLLALRAGGLSAVIKSLDKFKETPEVSFAIKCGGVENAKAVLDAIQGKVDLIPERT